VTAAWSSFPERFLSVARSQPNQTAISTGKARDLSYAEVLGQATALGELLRSLGAGPDVVVGLALPKSPEYVVALLGIWWAGAAFLPLAPDLPPERRSFLVGDAGLRLAVSAPGMTEELQQLGVRTVPPPTAAARGTVPRQSVRWPGPDDLAYLIYTSGSTGRPKGVLVPHRGFVNLLDAQIPVFELAPGNRALWLLHPGFDASISDVGTALLAGATLCIDSQDACRQAASLAALVREHAITHLDLPPALLRVLDPDAMPASLQTLIIGGEPCPPAVVRHWAQRFRVVNVYGPTEATVCTSLCQCDPETWEQPLLGRPIPGVRYQVLDAHREPVPSATPGELSIGGVCLARGYRNLPELTAEKFIQRDGERLYRTGDLVLQRADGEYVFLGRMDRQVKIRGQLVEPEEVEARLQEHPEVRQAAVVKRSQNAAGSAREGLVAFVVTRTPGQAPAPETLRKFLARSLPQWMLPQRFEVLADFPRLASGKVDLAALEQMSLDAVAPAAPGPIKGQAEESLLAEVWAQVLGTPQVSRTTGFFDAGGDSLALLEVVTAARARGLTIPPALLAEGRSIAELAEWHRSRQGPKGQHDPPPGAMACIDLRREAASLPVRQPRPGGDTDLPEAPQSILLTGGTGFLGSWLLAELLERTTAEVFCLVRAGDVAAGRRRLQEALDRWGLGLTAEQEERIRAVPGDLAHPRLGLACADWDRLATHIDTVYHGGAWVNLVLPYTVLRPTNVLGTREVLQFLADGRPKRLHHASTLSVFVASDRNRGRLAEEDTLAETRWVYGGYAQTKWAAEWLLRAAGGTAGPVAHYRLGLLTGDTRTGRAPVGDFLMRFLRGLARLGAVPRTAGMELFLDVTPVDFAAAALAHLSLHAAGDRDGMTFHLANPHSLSLRGIVAAMRSFGIPLEELESAHWQKRFGELRRGDPDVASACLALCRLLPSADDAFAHYRTLDLFQATGVEFAQHNTLAGLAGSGLACPPPTQELLHTYLCHL
jgi:amino acid adenylation domain-containing protein/thioester reductase-like protein